ncbi:hypothetical protein C2E23DRAFT_880631 [Lenzites betulinus]|nr:hypothetical protein C2E23DRAFT_880631 [Lenzites betulinus]
MPEDGQNISSAFTPSRTSAVFDYDNHTETNTGHDGAMKMAQTSPVTTPTGGIPAADGGTSKSLRILPRDVWSPPITAPDDSAVWTTGSMVKVTWDTSTPPKHVTNFAGKLVLGYLDDSDGTDEHLDFDNPLADGFNLTQGHVTVRVPDVHASNEYIVVLFGDSGNKSPKFTIVN